jgi:molybdopterin-guanine dinucleotide biosynthesis protein A
VTRWTAIVLTGGRSTRLGQDKATAVVAGRRMVDRVVAQIPVEVPVVLVGPDPGVARPVVVTREEPAGGGPAAAVAAGLRHVRTEAAAVLAADMPFAVPVVMSLLPRLGAAEAVVPMAGGQPQSLCAVYSTAALRRVRVTPGTSMRQVLAQLDVDFVQRDPGDLVDIDTPSELEAAARRLTIMEADRKGRAMQEWVAAVKEQLGIDASVDVDLILDVAKDAAHGVQRPAAPVTTYLLGLAVAGGADPAEAAARIAALAQSWSPAVPDA